MKKQLFTVDEKQLHMTSLSCGMSGCMNDPHKVECCFSAFLKSLFTHAIQTDSTSGNRISFQTG